MAQTEKVAKIRVKQTPHQADDGAPRGGADSSEFLRSLDIIEALDLIEVLAHAFKGRHATAQIQVYCFFGAALENRGQYFIADFEIRGPIALQPSAEVDLVRHPRLLKIRDDAIGDPAVGLARLVGVFDLEVAIVGGQGVERAAAGFLRLVL